MYAFLKIKVFAHTEALFHPKNRPNESFPKPNNQKFENCTTIFNTQTSYKLKVMNPSAVILYELPRI